MINNNDPTDSRPKSGQSTGLTVPPVERYESPVPVPSGSTPTRYPEGSASGAGRQHRNDRSAIWWYIVGVPAGWAICWVVITGLGISVTEPKWTVPVITFAVTIAAVGVGAFWLARTRSAGRGTPPPPARLLVIGAAVFSSGMATLALHGTRWSFNGLYSDAGFRTQAATRFADSPALNDYGYLDLPAYYPPGLPWIQGRLADLLHQPAWAMMKPVALVLAALIPLLAYALWRRVMPDLPAALVTSAATLFTVELDKPDEWLLLLLLVPWWMDAVRGLVRPGHNWPSWKHGLVLGGLLWVHLYYFLPMGIATLLALGLDRITRRSSPLPVKRALSIGGIGLLVAAPYWVPTMVFRLVGPPTDALQMRWSPITGEGPTYQPTEAATILGEIGLIWLILRSRRNRHAQALALALAGTLLVLIGGAGLQQVGIPLLAEKSDPLVMALGVVTGVLALYEAFRWARQHTWPPRYSIFLRRAIPIAGIVAAMTVTSLGAFSYTEETAYARRTMIAHQTPYPTGDRPENAVAPMDLPQPWGTEKGPPVTKVRAAWHQLSGRSAAQDSSTVLVTTRVDLVATTPVHTFTPWKSIYSHPNGQYADRIALLHRVADCSTSQCAADLLRHNRFDRVDGLVMRKTADGDLIYPMAVDNFPDGWLQVDLRFSPKLFAGPGFSRHDVDNVAVIAVQ